MRLWLQFCMCSAFWLNKYDRYCRISIRLCFTQMQLIKRLLLYTEYKLICTIFYYREIIFPLEETTKWISLHLVMDLKYYSLKKTFNNDIEICTYNSPWTVFVKYSDHLCSLLIIDRKYQSIFEFNLLIKSCLKAYWHIYGIMWSCNKLKYESQAKENTSHGSFLVKCTRITKETNFTYLKIPFAFLLCYFQKSNLLL